MGLSKVIDKFPKIMRHIYTMLIVMVAWVFFRAENITLALDYIRALCSVHFASLGAYVLTLLEVLTMVVAIFFAGFHRWLNQFLENRVGFQLPDVSGVKYTVSIGIYVLAVCSLAAGVYNPFIYFRF